MTTLVRFNRTPLSKVFEDAWRATTDSARLSASTPAMDVINFDDRVEIQVELPGIKPDDVNIEIKDQVLTISTNWDEAQAETDGKFTHRERYVGAYRRSLRLPNTIDFENGQATFDNGVLTLTLPHREETQPLRIPVNGVSNN